MNRKELLLALRTVAFLDAHAGERRGVLELRARPSRRLLVWHPDAIDQIFRSDARMRHEPSRTLSPLLGPRSLLWAQGSRHTAYRRALGPALRGRRLAAYHGIIRDTTHAAIDALTVGRVLALSEWTRSVTLRIIGRIVLDRTDDTLLAPFTRWIERALGSQGRTLAYRYLAGGLPASGADLDRLLVRGAEAAARAGTDTLATLLLTDGGPLGAPVDGPAGQRLRDQELRDQIVSLLFAGHETTASAIAWTLLWLARDDRLRRDVVAELLATPGDGADAGQVPLLQAVINEALRLSPPATLAGNRVPPEDGELLGERLAAGTVLTPSIYLAHRQPDRFPDPLRFDPKRFLGNRVPGSHYFPFGGGIRRCLGSELALLEVRMIVTAVLRRLELHCINPIAGIPQMRGPAMAPAARLRMAVTACRD